MKPSGTARSSKPLVVASVIAAASIMFNVYLIQQPQSSLSFPKQSPPSMVSEQRVPSPIASEKIAVSHPTIGNSGETQLLLSSLHEKVNRNSEQLELLIATLTVSAAEAEKQAELQAARELASAERRRERQEQMLVHLNQDERAVAFHERWLQENEAQLQHTAEELYQIEQSGIEALAAYERKKEK